MPWKRPGCESIPFFVKSKVLARMKEYNNVAEERKIKEFG